MNRIRIGYLGGADDSCDIEITLGWVCRPDANRPVGLFKICCVLVRFRIDNNRLDAQFMTCPYYPQRNLAAICYQYL